MIDYRIEDESYREMMYAAGVWGREPQESRKFDEDGRLWQYVNGKWRQIEFTGTGTNCVEYV